MNKQSDRDEIKIRQMQLTLYKSMIMWSRQGRSNSDNKDERAITSKLTLYKTKTMWSRRKIRPQIQWKVIQRKLTFYKTKIMWNRHGNQQLDHEMKKESNHKLTNFKNPRWCGTEVTEIRHQNHYEMHINHKQSYQLWKTNLVIEIKSRKKQPQVNLHPTRPSQASVEF